MSRFGIETAPIAQEQTVVVGKVRFSVITDRILRVERSESGEFLDKPTQSVMCREFDNPQFTYTKNGNEVRIVTKCTEFSIDLHTLSVLVKKGKKWTGAPLSRNLKGTARTLDMTLGRFKLDKLFLRLEDGIFSKDGVTEFDDSTSYVLNEDGSVEARKPGSADKYVFAFNDDYLGGLKEFYSLTGFTPLLPKYALGNWWSRYYAYKQDEYIALMDKFAEKDIPLTVATVDMDWHIVKNVPAELKSRNPFQGPGWTGYTFEKELFPDYKQFFKDVKARGLAITMNLHPRDGIRYYETQYQEMAEANGIDPSTKQPVEFDFTSQKYIDSYFDLVLHPYEEDGVDFWWIDWQQGTKSKLEGLDPLWLLNHYHTLDAGREGRTPLILSRYAGVGSHRYPLGFSGDTIVSWASLRLQPYFTATASNVGYTWWSHDIGGHMFSRANSELYVRWLQFGVFSPINRLHSSNIGIDKEPWLYGEKAEKISADFMRLRHRMLPYLYTANVRTAKEGLPLISPMYYFYKCKDAYKAKNQYLFGSELLVAPVIRKGKNGISPVKVYLPEGEWTDFFTGEKFVGGKVYELNCPLERIPVFAKSGAIIPLLAERAGNSQKFNELEVRVYLGNNTYRMYDEEGYIDFEISYDGDSAKFSVKPSSASLTSRLNVFFADVKQADIYVDGVAAQTGNRIEMPLVECDMIIKNIK